MSPTSAPTTSRPDALLVLGMHRSGTSATAGALAAAGFHMGTELIEGAHDNPGGYFEHAGVVTAHEALLESLDRAWDDVRALPAGWATSAAAGEARSRLAAFLAQDLRAPWAIKDPRLCRLLPLWTPLLRKSRKPVAMLLVLRHPDEVAASLARRDRMPPDVAHLLWLRHVLEAEAQSRAWPRACILYDALLQDAGRTLSDALQACGIQAPGPLATAARHVSAEARHESARSGPPSPWRALALSLHEAVVAVADGDRFAAIAGKGDDFSSLLDTHAAWVDAIGRQQSAGRAGIGRWRDRALAAETRAERLQAGLDAASALSLARLEDVHCLDARLARTSEALHEAEQLLQQCRAGGAELAEQVRAERDVRDNAERLLSDARAEAAVLTKQVRAERAARSEAERLLSEARDTGAELLRQQQQARDALDRAAQRLGEAQAHSMHLERQLRSQSEACGQAEALASARLEEITRREAVVAELATARRDAEQRAIATRSALQALEGRLAALADGLAAFAADESDRLLQAAIPIEASTGARDRDPLQALAGTAAWVETAMARTREALAMAVGRIQMLEDDLHGMRASRWWRMGRPFRAVRVWMLRRRPSRSEKGGH